MVRTTFDESFWIVTHKLNTSATNIHSQVHHTTYGTQLKRSSHLHH